ncbi:MAG: pyrimidine-nucleoside phosphorylase [Bacilli bacterium]|nr:pyrimidine-nucleoside phosphorylase [Bacilli bacterium]
MRMVDIIERKRDGHTLSEEEIRFFVQGYVNGDIPDYQASAFAMAVYFRGMDAKETAILTDAMMHSGDTIDLSPIQGIVVDKHSTGGVGDKASLVVGPLVAACGAKVGKMSGRGLGHTGGTLDKMESVPGMDIFRTREQFIQQVNDIGLAIIGQTGKLVPADKKLYALRDVTGTIPSIPLIASSIMSKKLAAGSDAILLDVKFGSGAFMKTLDDARTLAKAMVEIGTHLGRDTRAVITDMEQPLGLAVGNALEVKEAIATLHGKGPKDLVELAKKAGAIMLQQAKIVEDLDEGERRIMAALEDGSGFRKLVALFDAQGGDVSYITDPSKFPVAKHIIPVKASRGGYLSRIDSLSIGVGAMKLGAGRETMEDKIDMSAGILLEKKVGDKVEEGDVLCYCHTNKLGVDEVLRDVHDAFVLSDKPVDVLPIVHEYIHN